MAGEAVTKKGVVEGEFPESSTDQIRKPCRHNNKVGFYSIDSGKPRKDLEQGSNVISFTLKPHSGCGK